MEKQANIQNSWQATTQFPDSGIFKICLLCCLQDIHDLFKADLDLALLSLEGMITDEETRQAHQLVSYYVCYT